MNCYMLYQDTWCIHNALNLLQNPHKIHPIAHPLGRDIGCYFDSILLSLFCFNQHSAVWNIVLYWTALHQRSTVYIFVIFPPIKISSAWLSIQAWINWQWINKPSINLLHWQGNINLCRTIVLMDLPEGNKKCICIFHHFSKLRCHR